MRLILLITLLITTVGWAAETITKEVVLDKKALEAIGITYETREGKDENLKTNYTDHEFRFKEQKISWRLIKDTLLDQKMQAISASITKIDRDSAAGYEEEDFTFSARVYEGEPYSHQIEFLEPSSIGAHCYIILIKPKNEKMQNKPDIATPSKPSD